MKPTFANITMLAKMREKGFMISNKIKKFLYFILLSAWVFVGSPAYAENLAGKVVNVHDGDTITVLDSTKHQIKIRLAEIDAPELKQPYGNKSKQMLSDLVFGKDITVVKSVIDKYGRTVGRIYQSTIDVNLTMVKQGGAWAYRQYLTDKNILAAEEFAKAAGAGLWGLQADQRMPPWEWRRGDKQTTYLTVQTVQSTDTPNVFTCREKTKCSQMASCAEAKFYLSSCGLARLDGDRDGVPCEGLCR